MNIESLIDAIKDIRSAVEGSGFKRDIQEYVNALARPETQTNLASLKDIAQKARDGLQRVIELGVGDLFDRVRPRVKSFTDYDHLPQLDEILNDPDINTALFYSKLNSILTELRDQINTDMANIGERETMFREYSADAPSEAEEGKAIISIILHDLETITGLKHFARTLDRWNQVLLLYHQLIASNSPEEIELLEVQNGSIDIIVNIDIKVAVDLAVVMTIGYKAFRAFLEYRLRNNEILANAPSNKKVFELERKAEALLLDGVRESIEETIREQHARRKTEDKAITGHGIDAAVKRISGLIADQIIKGNELKLLTASTDSDSDSDQTSELKEQTASVQSLFKKTDDAGLKLLTTKYELPDEDEPKTDTKK